MINTAERLNHIKSALNCIDNKSNYASRAFRILQDALLAELENSYRKRPHYYQELCKLYEFIIMRSNAIGQRGSKVTDGAYEELYKSFCTDFKAMLAEEKHSLEKLPVDIRPVAAAPSFKEYVQPEELQSIPDADLLHQGLMQLSI